jgi:hypothetical protein
MLLIGDQDVARKRMQELGKLRADSDREFTSGNYYRYFPEMTGPTGRDWHGRRQLPRAAGFGTKN